MGVRDDYVPGIAGRIAWLRRERGWSQNELGRRLNGSESRPGEKVRGWECEFRTPTARTIILLAQLFGVSTDFLLGHTPPCGCNPMEGRLNGR